MSARPEGRKARLVGPNAQVVQEVRGGGRCLKIQASLLHKGDKLQKKRQLRLKALCGSWGSWKKRTSESAEARFPGEIF